MTATEQITKYRALFDLNIILDVLMRREPYFSNAARLWALVETGQIEGLIAAHSFTTLFYLFRKQNNYEHTYKMIKGLLKVFSVAGIDHHVIEKASDFNWRDFEDAVQAVAADEAGCNYLITRNPEDFKAARGVIVIQPADFIAIWAASKGPE